MSSRDLPSVNRRRFLAAASAAGAAVGLPPTADAQTRTPPASAPTTSAPIVTAASEQTPPPELQPLTTNLRGGADFMLDVIKSLDIKYIAANCASSFRGLQESTINYAAGSPTWLTCTHEETSTAIAHGYYKITGKPMISMVHAVVGLQHASMAIYNAFCDRAGMIVIAGNSLDETLRRPGAEWNHSIVDQGAMVRDYTKWDDQPVSLQHFADSMVRAYQLTTSGPHAPVLLAVDSGLQEDPIAKSEERKLFIPKLGRDLPPQADDAALRETARILVAAENPVIVADRYGRDANALNLLVQLAEVLQAPVIDLFSRPNMPNQHWLQQSFRRRTLIAQADVILALEPVDLWAITHNVHDQLYRSTSVSGKPNVKIITISTLNLLPKGNIQSLSHYGSADLSIVGDAQASMPALIDFVQRELSSDRRSALEARGQKLQKAWKSGRDNLYAAAAGAWDATPVSTARVSMELWDLIKDDDWGFGGSGMGWEKTLWNLQKRAQFPGSSGGNGLGWNLPSSVGSALANRDEGRYTVAFQRDGDTMYLPGSLWTAAHHSLPLLSVVHNNRAWHQELMHIQRVAFRHGRGANTWKTGTTMENPYIDFAMLAKSMGIYSEGPVTSPADIRPALQRALAVVKKNEPALVDIVMQPR